MKKLKTQKIKRPKCPPKKQSAKEACEPTQYQCSGHIIFSGAEDQKFPINFSAKASSIEGLCIDAKKFFMKPALVEIEEVIDVKKINGWKPPKDIITKKSVDKLTQEAAPTLDGNKHIERIKEQGLWSWLLFGAKR